GDQRGGGQRPRERPPSGIGAAKRTPERDRDRSQREERAELDEERQRAARHLLEEHVTNDPEAGDDERERRPDAGEREAEAVAADDRADGTGAEPEGAPDEPVRYEGPAEGRQLARAVLVGPHGDRLGAADEGAGEEPAREPGAECACPSVHWCAASRSGCPCMSGGTGTPRYVSAVGARSTITGSSAASRRDARMTPGVSTTSEAA